MNTKIDIGVDSAELDQAIEKANRLVELLREVQQIADSLFKPEGVEESRGRARFSDRPVY